MSAHHITRVLGVAVAMTLALASGPTDIPSASADPCPDVEVVFARGTGDTPGVGKVGQSFVDYLRPQIGGRSLGVYGVNYPATFAFGESANDGANDVSGHVQDMIGRCPNTRMVLGGISQGAGVMDFATNNMPPAAADHGPAGQCRSKRFLSEGAGKPSLAPQY